MSIGKGCMRLRTWMLGGMMAALLMTGCTTTMSSSAQASGDPVGTIRACKWTMGEEACGKCYALETEEFGSNIIDKASAGGDLAQYLDKKVTYQGTRDLNEIHSTKMCPATIRLTKIALVTE